ncbi:MAG: acyl--CoA ligase [Oscillospiraceae bacterium]|jgi:acyl-CoA synthetase (AMP-forming)/AMP-acid ligase II|nr:acyl--CoA ligase [Oscillospiraceae bacterium]
MPITRFLESNARQWPDSVALVEINPSLARTASDWREFSLVETAAEPGYRKELTWQAFDDRANQIANLLLGAGIKRGEKVALLLMNCLEWLPVYFGILKTGALAVPMNFRYTSPEIEYCLKLADCKALIFGPEFIERVGALPDSGRPGLMWFIGNERVIFARDMEREADAMTVSNPGITLTDEDDAAIYFSSGTTGFPKAILHDHGALVCACETEQAHHGQTREDVFLCIPPLYHTGAKMHWFGSLMVGGRAVLLRGTQPEWILRAASVERASIVWLLVPWAQDIMDAIDRGTVRLSDYDLSAWRLMHIGAQPVPPSLIKRWRALFPNHDYDTNYGLSESTGPGAVHLGVENLRKVGAIGVAGAGWQARIVGDHGGETATDEVGELIVAGRGVMKEYYKDPAATAAALKDGWLYTGDMARRDADGFIWLVDRKKDVVITGGENLYPVQIEDFLRGLEQIKDVAVIGLPDARLGEIAAAIIELKPGAALTEADVEAFCRGLPRYKRPRRIIFDAVPRNLTGKIEKPKLRERYCAARLVEAETTR